MIFLIASSWLAILMIAIYFTPREDVEKRILDITLWHPAITILALSGIQGCYFAAENGFVGSGVWFGLIVVSLFDATCYMSKTIKFPKGMILPIMGIFLLLYFVPSRNFIIGFFQCLCLLPLIVFLIWNVWFERFSNQLVYQGYLRCRQCGNMEESIIKTTCAKCHNGCCWEQIMARKVYRGNEFDWDVCDRPWITTTITPSWSLSDD